MDLNGKKQDWEALVLICFIDQARLLAAMKEREHLLTKEEKLRNVRSLPVEHVFNLASSKVYKAPARSLPDVDPDRVRAATMKWPHSAPDRKHVLLCEGVDMMCYMAGYVAHSVPLCSIKLHFVPVLFHSSVRLCWHGGRATRLNT